MILNQPPPCRGLPAREPGHHMRPHIMGWLFSHRDKDSLVQRLLEPAESSTHKRTILEHALTGQELWTVVQLEDRKSTRLNSSHSQISYAVFCLKKKKK